MPDTVGINKYANCVELKPKWSTINIGLDKTYKKNPEKFAPSAMTSSKNSLSEKIVLYRCVTAEKEKETRYDCGIVSGKNFIAAIKETDA